MKQCMPFIFIVILKFYIKSIPKNSEITILVEGLKDTNEIFLHVSYVVYNASWTPKYDIRVFSNDKTMIVNNFIHIFIIMLNIIFFGIKNR